jgi:hypothetical protein
LPLRFADIYFLFALNVAIPDLIDVSTHYKQEAAERVQYVFPSPYMMKPTIDMSTKTRLNLC